MLTPGRLLTLTALCLLWAPAAAQDDPLREIERLNSSGEREKACQMVEVMVQGEQKNDARANLYWAYCLRRHNRPDEAREYFQRATVLDKAWVAEAARRALTEMQPVQIQSSPTKGGRKGYIGLLFHDAVVIRVLPGSPAQQANLARGDVLVSANGVALSGLGDEKVSKQLSGLVGAPIDLIIERQNKRFSCRVIRGEATEQDGGGLPLRVAPATPDAYRVPSASPSTTSPYGANQSIAKPAATTCGAPLMAINFKRRSAESDVVKNDVIIAFSKIPRNLLQEVVSDGVQVMITPTMPEGLSLSGRPRGYSHGGGYDNCGALFSPSEKMIFIAERVSRGNQPAQKNAWITASLLHEFGHALDHVRKISASEEFIAACKADCSRLSNTTSSKYYYYTQNPEGGASELFAELFAHAVGGDNVIEGKDMPNAFPKAFAIVNKVSQRSN